MTEDSYYDKASLLDVLNTVGFICIIIMTEKLVCTRPFVAESHMDTAREDLLDGEVGGLRNYSAGGQYCMDMIDGADEQMYLFEEAGLGTALSVGDQTEGNVADTVRQVPLSLISNGQCSPEPRFVIGNEKLAQFVIPDADKLGRSYHWGFCNGLLWISAALLTALITSARRSITLSRSLNSFLLLEKSYFSMRTPFPPILRFVKRCQAGEAGVCQPQNPSPTHWSHWEEPETSGSFLQRGR